MGPRMAHILRNATMTALHLPNPSLYTLQQLLTDRKYQRSVAKTLKDPVLKLFWDKEFAMLGSMQMATVTAPLTHRLGQFITSKTSRHILLQKKSTVRVADIMNEGKILLANLSKGDIGEDKSQFFGTILTSFIWMAAYQRTKVPEKKRRNFFLYVDEFQNFASPNFSDIVSEGRKYHIGLIVSHQSIAQIEDKSLVKLIAGNASTLICLKVSPEDEAFILPYMKTEVKMGDIINLAPYHFYMKTTSDASEDAFSGVTVPLDVESNDAIREAVVVQSRKRYGTAKTKVEAYMVELFSVDSSAPMQEVRVTARRGRNKGAEPSKKPEITVVRKVHGG
jgi:TraM recognition site of TraD and TraG